MAIQKYVAISYCFAFLSVYLGALAYTFISEGINISSKANLPQITTMNASLSAVSSLSDLSGISYIALLAIVGIVTVIILLIAIIISTRAMASAV